jgi:hypothetical protein
MERERDHLIKCAAAALALIARAPANRDRVQKRLKLYAEAAASLGIKDFRERVVIEARPQTFDARAAVVDRDVLEAALLEALKS